jgi:hypothetical protein
MSHLLSLVLRFHVQAEPMLKTCAELKNMAKSTLKCPFKVSCIMQLVFLAHRPPSAAPVISLGEFLRQWYYVMKDLGGETHNKRSSCSFHQSR